MKLTNSDKSGPSKVMDDTASKTTSEQTSSAPLHDEKNLPLSKRLEQASSKLTSEAAPTADRKSKSENTTNHKREAELETESKPSTPTVTLKNPTKTILKQKITVKKYGFMYAVFRPLSIAAMMLVGTYATISIGMNFWHGYQRDLDYTKSRHIDHTAFEIFQKSSISQDKIELIIRNFDGELEKRVASHSQLAGYIKLRAEELETARIASQEQISKQLTELFSSAFTNKEEAISAYADWFFEWKRPYIILKEAISSTTSRLIKLGQYESLRTAVERDMSDYFMSHYNKQVLKPEERDEILVAGIEKIAKEAHKSYLATMAIQDAAMRGFLKANTTYLETIPKKKTLTKVTLDWDAQRWKTPTYLMEDRAFNGIAGIGRVAVGGTIGALAIGPAVNKGLGSVFTPLARRFATSMGARITLAEGGAVAGTVVEPVGGTIVGAAIGVVLGFAADYVANKLNEKFSRDGFIKANQKALQSTISLWQQKMDDNLKLSTGQWYDEAKAGLILVQDNKYKKPGSKTIPPEEMSLF